MADRYWVGGNGTWNTTDTTHWAASSGGSGGETAPTSSDNVFFDNSSSGTTTLSLNISENVSCNNIDFSNRTSYNIQLTTSNSKIISVYGDFTGYSTIFSSGASRVTINFMGTTTQNFSPNGGKIPNICKYGAGTLNLTSDLLINPGFSPAYFRIYNGVVNFNNYNITNRYIEIGAVDGNITCDFGSSVITLTSGCYLDIYNVDVNEVTLDSGTSSVIINGGDGIITTNITPSLYNVWFQTSGYLLGNINYTELKIDAGLTVYFLYETTHTSSSFIFNGASGNEITLNTYNNNSNFILYKTGGGTITCDYVNINYCTASPNYTWYATNSTIDAYSTGWNQIAPYTSPFPAFRVI